MLRAMDSGVAGLRSHQNKLDVISNNIANVNTFGFKAQTFSFKDTMYQTSSASTAGKANENGIAESGGTNASQYGYGSLTGSIATDFTSSTPTYIGGFSGCVNGPGFFITNSTNNTTGIVTDTEDSEKTTTNMKAAKFAYTRVGQFNVDANGYIVDSNGNFVYGYRPNKHVDADVYGGGKTEKTLFALRAPVIADDATLADIVGDSAAAPTYTGEAKQLKSVEIGNNGLIKGIIEVKDGDSVVETSIIIGKVAIASFQNQEGLTKAGNNTFNSTTGDNTGKVGVGMPGEGSTPSLMAGYVEGSNTDLAKEFSDMITTQRGFQANSKIITVSDEILQELVNMKR